MGSLSNTRLVHAKYQLNHRVVAFLQNCGAGGEHAAALAGFLNLQPSSQYSYVYSSTEDEWGQVITEVANQSMEDGLELEKSAMLAHYDGGVGFDEMYADAEGRTVRSSLRRKCLVRHALAQGRKQEEV